MRHCKSLAVFSISNTVCRGCCACVGDALVRISPDLCGWHICCSGNLYRALGGNLGMDGHGFLGFSALDIMLSEKKKSSAHRLSEGSYRLYA